MTSSPLPPVADFTDSWEVDLTGRGLVPGTVIQYLRAVARYAEWCQDNAVPPVLDRTQAKRWVGGMLAAGLSRTTVRDRLAALKLFSAWLLAEKEIDTDPLIGLKSPKLDQKVIVPLTADQLRALVASCDVNTFRDRRDEAVIRFMAETGIRAAELVAMTIMDTDIKGGIAIVRRGKGGKGRRVAFGPQTARALDRYMRKRRTHAAATSDTFWLGDRNATFGYQGLYKMLTRRACSVGITDMHPHRLRHTFAQRWLAAGGSEGGAMKVAGWANRDMIDRYSRSLAEERALQEAHKLNLGDV